MSKSVKNGAKAGKEVKNKTKATKLRNKEANFVNL